MMFFIVLFGHGDNTAEDVMSFPGLTGLQCLRAEKGICMAYTTLDTRGSETMDVF